MARSCRDGRRLVYRQSELRTDVHDDSDDQERVLVHNLHVPVSEQECEIERVVCLHVALLRKCVH